MIDPGTNTVTPNREVNDKPTTAECNAAIFDSMYECGENVSLVDTLVKIGTERLGVPGEEADKIRTHLQHNVGAKEVMTEIQTGRKRYQISGVPFFVVGAVDGTSSLGRPYGFLGAQNSSTFENIFEEWAERSRLQCMDMNMFRIMMWMRAIF